MIARFLWALQWPRRYTGQTRELRLIRASGLFNEAWYLARNLDVAAARLNPAVHYLRYGGFEGRDPGPDFASAWYLENYADVKRAGLNPLVHYLEFGRAEGRFPNSQARDLALITSSVLFDRDWYLAQYSDVASAGIDPAVHYLRCGALEGRDPGPNFWSAWYLQTYDDVRSAGLNPLVHYLQYGRQESRHPNVERFIAASKTSIGTHGPPPGPAPRVEAAPPDSRVNFIRNSNEADAGGSGSPRADTAPHNEWLLRPLSAKGGGPQRFALMSYCTENLGDDIQSLAGLQFLPHVDALVDRDEIGSFESPIVLKIIMNGWFMGRRSWPPPQSLAPLYISFHIGNYAYHGYENPSSWLLSQESLEHFRQYQPIGCRDLQTVRLLEARGIDSYFSGCLTLTLPHSPEAHVRGEILLVDPAIDPRELFRSVPFGLRGKVSVIHPEVDSRYSAAERFRLAAGLLQRYSRAHLVVTSRLHCLLPCLAFGTPVIFIHPSSDPGRLLGYDGFCHTLPGSETRLNAAIPWERPNPNPTLHLAVAESLRRSVEAFVAAPIAKPGTT